MTATAADEQDLAKALDSVASATDILSKTSATPASDDSDNKSADGDATPSLKDLPPIIPPNSPLAPSSLPEAPSESEFPAITPISDNRTPLSGGSVNSSPVVPPSEAVASLSATPLEPVVAPVVAPAPAVNTDSTPVVSGPLEDIKKDALNELRPLVDKLNVSPEEKFDTLLLLIRSTDDADLIGPAHEAAKTIADETRRAEALLDVIKEIDYLSHREAQP
jgi:hypothetical protein